MKYGEWLEIWLEDYVRPSEKYKTYRNYADIVRIRLIPVFGACEMDDLTVRDLQHFVTELLHRGNRLTGQGLSENTVKTIVSVIKISLKRAYDLGYTGTYHAARLTAPHGTETEVVCFSEEEQRRIEAEIFRRREAKLYGIVLCLYMGLRLGELLALEWTDIDYEKRQVGICKTCHDGVDENGNYKKIVNAPKTRSSRRNIPLPERLIPLLDIMRADGGRYVVSERGETVRVRSYQRSYEYLLKRLQIPHRKFHALRHTFATRALECGMDVKTLSEILGHKSPAVTLNLYAHSFYKHKKEMMDLLADRL